MTITKIERQRHNTERFSIFLDGEFAFGMSGVDVLYYKLVENDELSDERYRFLVDEVLFTKAKDTALRFMGYRARSRNEIAEKLNVEYPEQVILRVIDMLEGYGYIDDLKFAIDHIHARLRTKAYGAERLKHELRQKGVDGKIIAQAIDEAFGDDGFDEVSAALVKLEKKAGGEELDRRGKQRIYDYLLRQGYGHGVINEAFKRYFDRSEQ